MGYLTRKYKELKEKRRTKKKKSPSPYSYPSPSPLPSPQKSTNDLFNEIKQKLPHEKTNNESNIIVNSVFLSNQSNLAMKEFFKYLVINKRNDIEKPMIETLCKKFLIYLKDKEPSVYNKLYKKSKSKSKTKSKNRELVEAIEELLSMLLVGKNPEDPIENNNLINFN
jgi:hypothetical protein